LYARAQLADPAPELRRGRAQARRGDATWRRRIERYECGDAVIVAFTASAVIDNNGQPCELRCFCHEILWVDRPVTFVVLRRRLLDLTRRDFHLAAARMRDSGIRVSADPGSIAIEIVIDATVAEYLAAPAEPLRLRAGSSPAGLECPPGGQTSWPQRPAIGVGHGI
jgi:hypothetical protein